MDSFRGRLLGQKYLRLSIRQAGIAGSSIARYGIRTKDINQMIETAVGGKVVSEIIEGNRRSPLLLRK